MMIACFVLVATAAVVGVTAAPSAEDTVMLSNQRPVPPLTAEELKRQLGGEIGEAIGAKKKFKAKRKKLHGRFLHISGMYTGRYYTAHIRSRGLELMKYLTITDIHPDPHYTPHSSPFNACHMPIATDPQAEKRRKKPDEGDDDSGDESELAGHFGAPTTSCDSPQALVNATFDWIKKELMGEDVEDGKGIDFVIWTGDSARHDNDVQRPRTEKEIMELNEMVVDKMKEVFGDKDGMGDENPGNDFKIPMYVVEDILQF